VELFRGQAYCFPETADPGRVFARAPAHRKPEG